MSILSKLPIPSIPLPYKILIAFAVILISCSVTGYYVHSITANSYQVKIDAANLAASKAEGDLKSFKSEADQKLKDKTSEISNQLNDKIASITADRNKYKHLFLAGSRLRDNANQSGGSGPANNSTTPGGSSDSASVGVLSIQTSEALYDIASDADRVAAELTSCQAWAVSVSETVAEYNARVAQITKTKP